MLLANAWVIGPTAVVAWAIVECVIGWLTLSFATGRWLWIILTSMFTAIIVTRGMVNLIYGGRDLKKLWI